MATATRATATGDPKIDTLLEGAKWEDGTLTYGFPTAASDWSGYFFGGEPYSGFTALNAAQQAAVAAALGAWAAVADLSFAGVQEPDGTAVLRFAGTTGTTTAHAYLPSGADRAGDVWFSPRYTGIATWEPGRFEHFTALHEIGHTLGLKHPHDSGDISGPADTAIDSVEFTVMSYRSYVGAPVDAGMVVESGSYPTGPMIHDIAAIQALYGPNYATAAGDTIYRFAPDSGIVFQAVWDGGGVDTYDLSAYGGGVQVTLAPGGWSLFSADQLASLNAGDPGTVARGNVANAYLHEGDARALIENAVGGAGGDRLSGNQAANTLVGNGGADTLSGDSGGDVLYGNTGADQLYGNTGGDTLFGGQDGDALFGGQDDDILYGQLADDAVYGQLGADTVFGGQGADLLFGGQGGDLLFGNLGDDVLVGNLGDDTMTGGGGADRFLCAGQDLITDFNLADGDRLVVAAGTVQGIDGTAAQAIVRFADGSSVALAGVAPGAVTADYFVT